MPHLDTTTTTDTNDRECCIPGVYVHDRSVVHKQEMKYYTNAKGEGKLFSVELMDASGGIRGTLFNDDADVSPDPCPDWQLELFSGSGDARALVNPAPFFPLARHSSPQAFLPRD